MQLLSKAISSILLADTDITDVVGSGNIWHAKTPQRNTAGTDAPADISILFYTYAITPNDTKSGRSEVDNHMVRVHVKGADNNQLSNVARYVRLSLDRIDPGEYETIYIAGSRFLNSYYDPDGEYELEHQEWILEFQFRVIDPDIRIPGGVVPDMPGFTGNYSTSEQIWPYGKWIGEETIYWKTFNIGDSTGGYVNLTGLTTAVVDKFIDIKPRATGVVDGSQKLLTAEISLDGVQYTFHTSSNQTGIYLTVWYTKV